MNDENAFFDQVYIALLAAHVGVHEKAFGPYHVAECARLAKSATLNREQALRAMAEERKAEDARAKERAK